jgi:hypothetical protein
MCGPVEALAKLRQRNSLRPCSTLSVSRLSLRNLMRWWCGWQGAPRSRRLQGRVAGERNAVSLGGQSVNDWRRITDFLALRRNTALLLAALVMAGTGERLWLGFAPKYLETLGATVLIIGLFDALHTLLGALYAWPGGWLTDRWGQRRSLLLFNALSLAGYVLVLLWQSWLALVLGAFLFLAWSALSLPATFAVIATSLHRRQHTMGVGGSAVPTLHEQRVHSRNGLISAPNDGGTREGFVAAISSRSARKERAERGIAGQ